MRGSWVYMMTNRPNGTLYDEGLRRLAAPAWMAGTSPAMTREKDWSKRAKRRNIDPDSLKRHLAVMAGLVPAIHAAP